MEATNENTRLSSAEVERVKRLLWGKEINHDVFRRWTQGLVFSTDESTALVQHDGGPCAILAPLQAFLLKNALLSAKHKQNWRTLNDEDRNTVLCLALRDIILLANSHSSGNGIQLVFHSPHLPTSPKPTAFTQTQSPAKKSTKPENIPNGPSVTNDLSTEACSETTCATLPRPDLEKDDNSKNGVADSPTKCTEHLSEKQDSCPGECASKRKRLSHEDFHSRLRCVKCSEEELLDCLRRWLPTLEEVYGVLMLLYSIIITKGLEAVQSEMEDAGESLIDGTYGHGSQSLINLMITGRSVSNVWDNDKDLSGLKLQGVHERSTIGFLTQMEHLRYCEVGWYLKNPFYPIWVLASETHLTVLFSQEEKLVCLESAEAQARRLFAQWDKDGCGFIPSDNLGPLLDTLNLVSDPEYVKIMVEKMDPEQLGIITLNSFMEEFFPSNTQPETVSQFRLLHYNGLARSCPGNKVHYVEGEAVIMEYPEVQIITDTSLIKTTLLTKWPTIELNWKNNTIPSLN